MSTPPLKQRIEFFRWTYARESFSQVTKACHFLASPPVPLSEEVSRILLIGIVATYARPFTNCRGIGSLPVDIVPQEYASLHKQLLDMRNKEGGHLDATDYEPDDGTFGNINQVRILIKRGYSEIQFFSTNLTPANIIPLSETLHQKAVWHVEKFRTNYIEKSTLRRGLYRLNIDDKDPQPFIKLP